MEGKTEKEPLNDVKLDTNWTTLAKDRGFRSKTGRDSEGDHRFCEFWTKTV